MRILVIILMIPFLILSLSAMGQKSKSKKTKVGEKGPKIFEVVGDSLRKDSVVFYETEIGYIMPDLSNKFSGKWEINVMRRQARATPDSLVQSFIEFYSDTLFTAFVGCNKISGRYIVKGPTVKFTVAAIDTSASCTANEIESWFIKLLQERVSYFGVDEKALYLKDVASNIVFDCSRKKEEEVKAPSSQK